MIRLVRIALLSAIWTALWSDVSPANVVSGLAVAALITAVVDPWHAGSLIVRPAAAARFVLYFCCKLVESSVVVARAVVAPRDAVHTGVVSVPLVGCTDAVATLIADAITLTPGTLTLEIQRDPLVLRVHALDVRDVEQVRSDVRRLEVLAIRAFGNAEALAGLADDDSVVEHRS